MVFRYNHGGKIFPKKGSHPPVHAKPSHLLSYHQIHTVAFNHCLLLGWRKGFPITASRIVACARNKGWAELAYSIGKNPLSAAAGARDCTTKPTHKFHILCAKEIQENQLYPMLMITFLFSLKLTFILPCPKWGKFELRMIWSAIWGATLKGRLWCTFADISVLNMHPFLHEAPCSQHSRAWGLVQVAEALWGF